MRNVKFRKFEFKFNSIQLIINYELINFAPRKGKKLIRDIGKHNNDDVWLT